MCDDEVRRVLTEANPWWRPGAQGGDPVGWTSTHRLLARRIWLLDEVSMVPGWTAIVKAARDGTDFGDDTVVVTGSRWRPDDDIQGNLPAGRAGSGSGRRLRHLLPMTFRDFLTTGAVSDGFVRDLAAWLQRDVSPDSAPESLPLLLDRIAARMTSPLNVRESAEELSASRTATTTRLNRLVATFAAIWCHQHDADGKPIEGAQSKLQLAIRNAGYWTEIRCGGRGDQIGAGPGP